VVTIAERGEGVGSTIPRGGGGLKAGLVRAVRIGDGEGGDVTPYHALGWSISLVFCLKQIFSPT
jgi:hypothetical protein